MYYELCGIAADQFSGLSKRALESNKKKTSKCLSLNVRELSKQSACIAQIANNKFGGNILKSEVNVVGFEPVDHYFNVIDSKNTDEISVEDRVIDPVAGFYPENARFSQSELVDSVEAPKDDVNAIYSKIVHKMRHL